MLGPLILWTWLCSTTVDACDWQAGYEFGRGANCLAEEQRIRRDPAAPPTVCSQTKPARPR